MRCWIELNAAALKHNVEVFRKLAGAAVMVPVIKSNAYGHGLKEIHEILAPLQPEWLGVNYLSEAESLRQLGYQMRILVVGPIHPKACRQASQLHADIFLSEETTLQEWLATPDEHKPRAHLKIDTGMSRQGFLPEEATALIARLQPHKDKLVGICSHFSNVEDVLEQNYANQQIDAFTGVVHQFRAAGFKLLSHMAASSSALIMQSSRFDLIRVGISIYGLWPSRATQLSFLQSFGQLVELEPVLSWKTEVAIVKGVHAGQFIGYGCTYKALRDMTIAVLPVGYYEGYPRLASNRGHVLIRGHRCPIVGRICMNMMMVDISHVPAVKTGEPVTLIGNDGKEHIDAAQIGEWAETIHYEIVTQLNPDIPRRVSAL
ncbi:MAG TPA: alanine racemase [Oligoflexus sp.]|uniref:alanine racemase n=1 Tax=Oligoflexus sp. TaxID=1971216 RepID=UPI002D6D370D|nr:alanine racemase [Oligoflexus sp.]HYX39294.1 alanine racemase [Oligoflexus sp.]